MLESFAVQWALSPHRTLRRLPRRDRMSVVVRMRLFASLGSFSVFVPVSYLVFTCVRNTLAFQLLPPPPPPATPPLPPGKTCGIAALQYGCGSCGPRGFYGTIDVHMKVGTRGLLLHFFMRIIVFSR